MTVDRLCILLITSFWLLLLYMKKVRVHNDHAGCITSNSESSTSTTVVTCSSTTATTTTSRLSLQNRWSNQLPRCIIESVATYLRRRDQLCRLDTVCKRWREISRAADGLLSCVWRYIDLMSGVDGSIQHQQWLGKSGMHGWIDNLGQERLNQVQYLKGVLHRDDFALLTPDRFPNLESLHLYTQDGSENEPLDFLLNLTTLKSLDIAHISNSRETISINSNSACTNIVTNLEIVSRTCDVRTSIFKYMEYRC